DSTMLLTASLEALAKFRSKDVSICLQHQFCVSLVPLLQAGLRSTSSELRRRSLQLAMKVLEMEDELLWPHLPDLLSTVADGEAPAELLAALGRMGSKLRPAFQDPGGGRFLKLLEDPRRGRFLLPFLPHLACGSLPEVAQRLHRVVRGELPAARAALADRRPSLEAVLSAIKLSGACDAILQVEGEKLTMQVLDEAKRGKARSWQQLLLCLDTFMEVRFLQKLLESSATGACRVAIWAAVGRYLRSIQSPASAQEESVRYHHVQIFLAQLKKDASSCCDPALRVCLLYSLVLLFAPCLSNGNVGDMEKLPILEAVSTSPFSNSRAFLALPSALSTRQRAGPFHAKECQIGHSEDDVELLLPCTLCKTSFQGECQCDVKLTIEWSILDSQSLETWSMLRSRGRLKRPEDFWALLTQLRTTAGPGPGGSNPFCLLEPTESQEAKDSQEERWLVAWSILGLCCCSPRDFLAAKAKEILGFFPLELKGRSPWDASRVNCHAALLQCRDFVALLVNEAELARQKKFANQVAAPPAVLAQNLHAMFDALLDNACSSDSQKGPNAALQRLLGVCMLRSAGIEDLGDHLSVHLLERYKEVRSANLCQLLLRGSMKSRLRRLLSKLVPRMVKDQRMDRIKELMHFLDQDLMPSFTPLLPYVLSEVAEENVTRIAASFRFVEQVYEQKLAINDICDAHWGTVLVRILWNSDRWPEVERCKQATACITRLTQALPEKSQDSKQREAEKGPVTKKRRGEKSVIDVDRVATPTGLTESGFLHALDILQIVISDSRENPKWQEYRQLLEDPETVRGPTSCPSGSEMEVPLDMPRFLRSASVLLELLGEQLHRFAVKMFEFLQCACARLQNADTLRCWKHFLRIGVMRLKPLLPALVSEMLKLAVNLQETDATAFQELQRTLVSIVQETLPHPEVLLAFPPLPDHLRGSRNQIEKALGKMSLQQRLESTTKQLEVSHQAVRHAILEGLMHFLTQQRKAFSALADLPGDVLGRLMKILLKFLSESISQGNRSSQLLCGQVLGAFGAIDPARLAGQVLVERHNPVNDHRAQKGEVELAKSVLEDFLAPHLTNNSFAFAAQEIFSHLKSAGKEQQVWEKLHKDAREALNPYRTSKYQNLSGDLLCSPTSFEGALEEATTLLPVERKAFFQACLPAAPGNHTLALFLMHHALQELIMAPELSCSDLASLAKKLVDLLTFTGKDAPESQETATAQAVFSLLDSLFQKKEEINTTPSSRAGDETWKKRQLQRIEALCGPFSFRLVLNAALRCGAHARALQFLEMELEATCGERSFAEGSRLGEADCELLQQIYHELGEPDGVVGAIRIGPNDRTRTSELELQGRWSDMQASYEQMAGHDRSKALCGLVKCSQAMCRFESSLQLISGIRQELPELTEHLQPRSVEAAWQLSSWQRLEEALEAPGDQIAAKDFQVQLGDVLLHLHGRDEVKLQQRIQETTVEVACAASLAARESYTRAYQHILRLHVLSDLQWLSQKRQEPGIAQNLLNRCDITTPSFSARQSLLAPLRVALQDLNLRNEAKSIELAFSRLCRKHNETMLMEHPDSSFQGTSSDLMVSAQLEWGKILYARGARHEALRHMLVLSKTSPRAQLLGTRWATDASLLLPRVAEAEFLQAKEKLNDEASFFYHAAYLDYLLKGQISDATNSLLQATPASKKPRTPEHSPFDRKNLVVFTFRGYLQALQRGTKRLRFILNRLLQLAWECCQVDFHKQEMIAEFQKEAANVPAWMWYSVLSQLISRALHPDLKKLFCDIIKSVTMEYPQQAAWHLVQLLKSQNTDDRSHTQLGKDIVQEVGRKDQDLHRLLCTRIKIAEDFGKLASTSGDSIQFAKDFPRLVGGGSRAERWQVLVPIQSQMTATIPRMDRAAIQKTADGRGFFPEVILSERCLEHVEVFRSKEKPKRVTFVGTDGRHYPFLCKAEKRGDLRKDSRLMEFAVMVNQLLAKSSDANRRNLSVRTFHVVILSEKCGLLEWVPNTKGLRYIIDELWKGRKQARQSLTEVKEMFDRSKDLHETFTRQVLPRHPPMLHKWFLKCGDPSVWFAKRVLFSQSQALWCMLGYLVGLGDRHLENILIDTESGRLVHVDFDCLFNKGMLLERPEMVPFRLTQNCVAAMGITGVEGIFRQCCEVTMEVPRLERIAAVW
ncbi:unnamed protein product, partial [Durusdinium trenchii]